MSGTITPNRIKQTNHNLIYRFIYDHPVTSQQDISYTLGLSRPTVTTNLAQMEEEGLIVKSGTINSDQVGRKASGYSIVPDYRLGIGVEIQSDEIKVVAVNLYGEYIKRTVYPIAYSNKEPYGRKVAGLITDFIDELKRTEDQILGVGIAIPGLVSPDGSYVTYGKILDCTGLRIERFSDHLPYPCRFYHDANAAAYTELWVSPELQNFFYFLVSVHLGAAMIMGREIIEGKHGHSGTVEHIVMVPGSNRKCYCGQTGCMETLISMSALLRKGESEEHFFQNVRAGKGTAPERWRAYLLSLAASIDRLHLVYDTDFILGGYLAPFLIEEDIQYLYEEIARRTPFEEAHDFIHIGKMPKHNITIGAALPMIRTFLDSDEPPA